ncbi:phosphotransferase family enzyme [Stackebrandtia albiflava]|uniref:Phosphotransferase family enzyme n=1 Tax=Stackebrandtia albiflava TaxID=406432 RepID=A0A562URB4_9ACTN|nr:aminoglycoside phosphotransferase family protein [Stackebrandtia albiflava]TWJ08162.1 phosphotransferase family enzyme [Stackebrandtia albiflava]
MEQVLSDQPDRLVVRRDDTVRRPVRPWTASVHGLLRHLDAVGFGAAPIPLGMADGVETVSYLPGDSGAAGWRALTRDAGVVGMARLLRRLHDAATGYTPPPDAVWVSGPHRPGEVIRHGDFGPWNLVWRDGTPIGVIDFELARPGNRLSDVAYALEYVAPFRSDTDCLRWMRYTSPPDRRRRIALFAEAYGLPSTAGLVDAVIEEQSATIDLVASLGRAGHRPQADWLRGGFLGQLSDRVRWSRRHRWLCE